MNSEEDMPMSMSEGAEESAETPDTEPPQDKDLTVKIKGTFNDALRVLMGKQKPKDARAS